MTAVVVDTCADRRGKDEFVKAKDLDCAVDQDMKFFSNVFANMDLDGSGDLCLNELIKGAQDIPEFRNRLRVLDITEADLKYLFDMLDEDKSLSIDVDEFALTLSRWRHESKSASRFVKYNTMIWLRLIIMIIAYSFLSG